MPEFNGKNTSISGKLKDEVSPYLESSAVAHVQLYLGVSQCLKSAR